LYRHLSYSDIRYIVLPKHDIGGPLSEPTNFVINHFNQVYHDNNYVVLEVPEFAPPTSSSTAEVGLVYNEKPDLILPSTEARLLQYDNKTSNLKKSDVTVTGKKENQNQSLDLIGSNRQNSTTLWSKNITANPIINSMETRFRVTFNDENNTNNYVGLKWREGDSEYFIKLLNSGLELHERRINITNFSQRILK